MTDGQQNLGGINLSLVAKCVRMHQVCWGESKIIVIKSAVLCEVFSSRTSKKAGNQNFKNIQALCLLPPQVWHVLPLLCGYQPLGAFIKHSIVPTFVFIQLFAPLPAGDRGLRQLLGGFSCCSWLEGALISTQTHTHTEQQQQTDSTGVSLVPLMLL